MKLTYDRPGIARRRFGLIAGTLVFLLLAAGCHRRPRIVVANGGYSAWDDNKTVSAQLQLQNVSKRDASQLRVTGVKVKGGRYQGPVPLPVTVGNVPSGKDAMFDALLSLPGANGSSRFLKLEGDYRQGGDRRTFRAKWAFQPQFIPPGPVTIKPGTTPKQNPATAAYPPVWNGPPVENNAESPMFVPIGPSRQFFPRTPTGTAIGTAAGGATMQIPRNTSMTSAGTPPDPNAAAASPTGVTLSTYNTGISVSTDGGVTFTDVALRLPQPGNPARTSFFPQDDGGLCCDQVVVYLPTQNIFVWLLQYRPITNGSTITQPNRLRIAWATPAAVVGDFWNAWAYCDLTGPGLGTTNAEWLDYPDLAFSGTFLYVGVDHGFPTPGQVYTGRRIVARMSLADIVNPAVTSVGYQFAELTGSNGLNKSHFVQAAPGRMVLGSLDNSSTMRVYTFRDNENSITSSTVAISQIAQGANYTSVAPDGSDWLATSFPGNITGSVYRNVPTGLGTPPREEYLFAFDAGANAAAGRPRAYLRLETLTPNGTGYDRFGEYDVWNNDYAFAMAALGTEGVEIALTIAVGGGTIGFPQHTVGFKDDFVVYQVTNSNATQISRFGDYFSTRPIGGGLFGTQVYDVVLNPIPAGVINATCATPGVGCIARMRFVQFGRPPVIIK